MTNERRAHQCHADGCDSEATHGVKATILCRAPGMLPVPVKLAATIKVCARHAVEGLVRKYLTSAVNRETITTGLMDGGFPEPDFLSLRIEFEPLQREFNALQARPIMRCDKVGCGKEAKWQIVQMFRMMWQRGKGKPQVKVLTNLVVCDEHRHSVKPAELKDKESESKTRAWLVAHGVSMPDFDTMTLDYDPIVEGKRAKAKAWVGDEGPLDQFKPKP